MNDKIHIIKCIRAWILIAVNMIIPGFAESADLTLSSPNVFYMSTNDTPAGLSGITFVGTNLFYAVNDSGATVHPLSINIDLNSGAVTSYAFGVAVQLSGSDLEGVAFDQPDDSLWVSDESDSSIREYSMTGLRGGSVDVPDVFRACRRNLCLESLTIGYGGMEMWTANEESLCGEVSGINDGPLATKTNGSPVRLQRFTRAGASEKWIASGQWTYITDPAEGRGFGVPERSGVADLCLLPDDRLLVLEREFSVKKAMFGEIPAVRTRIYLADYSKATDTSEIASLEGKDIRITSKKMLYGSGPLFTNFEGMCLGPVLEDGSYCLVLISDADSPALLALCTFRIKGIDSKIDISDGIIHTCSHE